MTVVSRPVLTVGVCGAAGRMGVRLIQVIAADPELRLGAAVLRPGDGRLGGDAGALAGVGALGVPLADRPESAAAAALDALIDVSAPEATPVAAEFCRRQGVALVVGTTGLTPEQRRSVEAAADRAAVLVSPNLSRAVNLLIRLAGEAAEALGGTADVEIVERHHRHKKDAPSGTALRLAEVVGRALGVGPEAYAHGRRGAVGPRPRGEIGIHALRTGDNPGEHTVVFGLAGECLELSHRALNRDGFVLGALGAAKFLAGKPPGLYRMSDLPA